MLVLFLMICIHSRFFFFVKHQHYNQFNKKHPSNLSNTQVGSNQTIVIVVDRKYESVYTNKPQLTWRPC